MNEYDDKKNADSENITEGNGFTMSDAPSAEDKAADSVPAQNASQAGSADGSSAFDAQPEAIKQTYGEQTSSQPNAASDASQQPYSGAAGSYQQNNQTSQHGAYQGANGYQYGAQQPYQNNANPYSYNSGNNNSSPYGSQGNQHYSNPYPYQNNGQYAYSPDNGSNGGKKKSKSGVVVFVILAVLLLVGAAIGIAVGVMSSEDDNTTNATGTSIENVDEVTTNETPVINGTASNSDALDPKEIFAKVNQSSVGILCYANNQLASEGTGVLFMEDKEGKYTYIVTCAHVISDAGISIMVQLYNEKEYEAQIIGYDTRTDIGVLRIEESGLQIAEFGDSSKLAVGDSVYAIGNPGGTEFANSFTSGMISAIDRPVSSSSNGYTMECIQHTAAINPGNSGGALLNAVGQVIGINSMKIVDDEYEGMGFSVPSSVFTNIVNEIIANGYVTNRPKLGVTYYPATDMQAYAMFVAIKGLPSGSIVINSISDDSALTGTDAKSGDMIIAVNGKELDQTSYLAELVENSNVGDELKLTLVRINNDYTFEQFDVTITLVEDKGDSSNAQEETTTSIFDYYFGNGNGGNYGGSYGGSGDYYPFG